MIETCPLCGAAVNYRGLFLIVCATDSCPNGPAVVLPDTGDIDWAKAHLRQGRAVAYYDDQYACWNEIPNVEGLDHIAAVWMVRYNRVPALWRLSRV